MSQQVKVPEDTKKELALFAALTGRGQGELLADAWREYRDRHGHKLSDDLKWAQEVLADPQRAAVEASGMDPDDLEAVRKAFE
ncbi:MAG: hypothetical protein QOC78_48 [Solirubrobacteraceae bacterium]|jgi:hypothetical protein|nr:hypothetical protein [Solirubrobacteraceae bacterium]MEA2393461.1 hypothetical protein [Solirubrobacteraceae bacterium]